MNTKLLDNKKILFIGPVTFQYHTLIYKELVKMGAAVDFFGESTESIFYRITSKLSNKLCEKYKEFFRETIWAKVKTEQYDYIFLIRGDFLNNAFLKKIKQVQSRAKLIMYQWDSVNHFNYLDLIDSFDKVYSFDPSDCKQFGFLYLPLFYDNDYSSLRNGSSTNNFDLLFVGTLHSDRLKILKEINTQAKEHNLTVKFYLYIPFLTFIKNILMNKSFEYNMNYIIFKPLNKNKLLDLLAHSNAVVDINNTSQTGLTMRTIETLGAGKKLITTNSSIKNESFYHNTDIQLLDRNNPIIDINFLHATNSGYSYSELNIKNWIKTIFSHK